MPKVQTSDFEEEVDFRNNSGANNAVTHYFC